MAKTPIIHSRNSANHPHGIFAAISFVIFWAGHFCGKCGKFVWHRLAFGAGMTGRAFRGLFDILQNSHALYSLKTFGAAMLALYISFLLDLSQPRWAVMTVYIVSQPFAGMVLSKSLARVFGTLLGAFMAVVILSLFHNMPVLFIGAIALWIGICLYVSITMRDRPGAYGAMLAGYTAAIVGFSSISVPETVFSTAVTRCIEILLGLFLATLASRIVLPRTTGRVFLYRVADTLSEMKRCIVDTLRGHEDDVRGLQDLSHLMANSISLESMRIHASRDTMEVRTSEKIVRALQGRVLSILSLMVSLHDRLNVLRRDYKSELAEFQSILPKLIQRIESVAEMGKPPAAALAGIPSSSVPLAGALAGKESSGLTKDLFRLLPKSEDLLRNPKLVIPYNIVYRILDLLAQWQEVNRLSNLMFSDPKQRELKIENLPMPPSEASIITCYRDHRLAMLAAVGSVITVVVMCSFWIQSGWPHGSSAAIFAGVVSCTMAVQDNPSGGAMRTLKMCVLAVILASIYVFAIFPRLTSFEELVFVLGLSYIPLGMLIPLPRFGPFVTPILIYSTSYMGLSNETKPNFAEFINSNSALMIGIMVAALSFRLLRPVSRGWVLGRHMSGMMKDLSILASDGELETNSQFETRMLDRIHSISLRVRVENAEDRELYRGALTVLRVGQNLFLLQSSLTSLPKEFANSVRSSLDVLSAYFWKMSSSFGAGSRISPLSALDLAMKAMQKMKPEQYDRWMDVHIALGSIRATLLQHAEFYGIGKEEQELDISRFAASTE